MGVWPPDGSLKVNFHFSVVAKSAGVLMPCCLGQHTIVPHRYSTTSWVDDTGTIHHVIGGTGLNVNNDN